MRPRNVKSHSTLGELGRCGGRKKTETSAWGGWTAVRAGARSGVVGAGRGFRCGGRWLGVRGQADVVHDRIASARRMKWCRAEVAVISARAPGGARAIRAAITRGGYGCNQQSLRGHEGRTGAFAVNFSLSKREKCAACRWRYNRATAPG